VQLDSVAALVATSKADPDRGNPDQFYENATHPVQPLKIRRPVSVMAFVVD
jgi:hypothetical protein